MEGSRVVTLALLSAAVTLLLTGCGGSSPPTSSSATTAFCAAYKSAQQAVDADYQQHPDLFAKAAAIAPADIKAAAEQVVAERTAAQSAGSTTQGALDGLTPSGIQVQTYCLGSWGGVG